MAQQYPPRRAPNVSQYIANLNAVPSEADMAQQQDFAGFDDDLALFTNTDFFDFDLGAPEELSFAGHDQRQPPARPASQEAVPNQQSFYHTFPQYPSSAAGSLPPSPPNGLPYAGQLQQSQPTVPSPQHFAATISQPGQSNKRKAGTGSIISATELEEVSRAAAEEDKRRRNTAASARFRVKKKQREQALEKTAKEMSDKVQILEARIGQLEMENQWLKGLITEKNVKLEGGPIASKIKAEIAAAVAAGNVKANTTNDDEDTAEDVDDAEDDLVEDADVTAADAEAAKKSDEAREEPNRISFQKKRGVGTVAEVAKA